MEANRDLVDMMANAAVYAVPLNHGDNKEYLRIRRDIEKVGRRDIEVAYEFPNTQRTRSFFKEVIGASGRDLEPRVMELLENIGVAEMLFENVACNLMELDRAKHGGLIVGVKPIDLDHNIADGYGRSGSFGAREAYEAQLIMMLSNEILGTAPFARVVDVLKAAMLAHRDVLKIRNMEMKRQVKSLLEEDGIGVILMTGAEHVPWMRRNLVRDHVAVQTLEDPRKVDEIGWFNYYAMQEAGRLERSGDTGMALARNAVRISMLTLRGMRGGSQLRDDEIAILKGLRTPQDAERQYLLTQSYYKDEFIAALPELRRP